MRRIIPQEVKTRILERTALAVGLKTFTMSNGNVQYEHRVIEGCMTTWNPLDYDSDAFFVQTKLGHCVSHLRSTDPGYTGKLNPHVMVGYKKQNQVKVFDGANLIVDYAELNGDVFAATRFAICAAAIAGMDGYVESVAEEMMEGIAKYWPLEPPIPL